MGHSSRARASWELSPHLCQGRGPSSAQKIQVQTQGGVSVHIPRSKWGVEGRRGSKAGRPRLGTGLGGQASKAKHWTPLKPVTEGGSLAPAWCPVPVSRVVVPWVPRATSSKPGHLRDLKRKGRKGFTC